MAALRKRRIELGGWETRALELDADGSTEPTLVLLHGYSDSADTWRPLMRLLAERGRGAVALDMPGFGEAERLARDRPVLPQLDRFTRAAIDHFAAESPNGRVVLAGNSLGGCVSLRAAQRREHPLEAIVPIAPAGLDLASWISIVEGAWAVQAVMRSPVPMPEALVRGFIGRAYRQLATAHPADVDPEQVASFTRHVATKRDVVRMLGTAQRIKTEIRDPFQLGWIECPVLVIWGDRDRMVSAAGAQRILDAVPTASLELIEDCGHCPQVERPDRVDELINQMAGVKA